MIRNNVNGEVKIGFYICHCGVNIAETVDVEAVRDYAKSLPNVTASRDYRFMCSNAGQELIENDIKELGINRVVVASCSPLMHEVTFRGACARAGLNPYLFQMANIREQCSWVHENKVQGTGKACALVHAAIARVAHHVPLEPIRAKIRPETMIVGAGIAGIQAALEIAESGNKVYLVEQESTIGGKMAQFDKTFPTLDCSACILTPKMVSVSHRDNIELMTLSKVEAVEGYVGNFKVRIRTKARYVTDACTSCGDCIKVCPVKVANSFDEGQSERTAIHKAFPQAVPGTFVIDKRERPPCKETCPIHQGAAGYVALIREGRFEEACKLVRRNNPLPSICGRVCYHPCESECNRGSVDQPIAIRDLKRFLMDWERENIGRVDPPAPENNYAERVAVIGSGPAGLTAAFDLAHKGYKVTILEKHDVVGGMLTVGLPEYRCPRDALKRDLDYIFKLGIKVQTGRELGRHFSLEDLFSDRHGFGFKAVFLAMGAHKGLKLNVPGEELGGVISGVDYLRHINLGMDQFTGRKVAVVGGGNTAMDAARTARREGAEVTVLYRRTQEEMPADPEEIEDAIAEDVKFHYLIAPVEILGTDGDGRVRGIRCVRMELGDVDSSGRRRPVPVPGSEHELEFDQVIVSVSQQPDRSWYGKDNGQLAFTKWDTVVAHSLSLQTDMPGVFAGGDLVLGPATVVEAMGQGRRAAEAIDKYLQGQPLRDFVTHVPPAYPRRSFESRPHPYAPRYEEIPHLPRVKMAQRDANMRTVGDYREVNLGLSAEQAQQESNRCLNCGVCVECYECERVCQPKAVMHDMVDTVKEIEVGQILITTGYQLFDGAKMSQYGYGRLDNVINSLEFERMLSAAGPTGGRIFCKNGEPPRSVGIIHCVGSRDEHYHRYCSRVCCMYALKFAHLVRERTHADVYQFYIDMRAFGKGYEEFYSRILHEGTTVIRGKGAEVVPSLRGNGDANQHALLVRCEDTMVGKFREIPVDMVVLCNALEPRDDTEAVARLFSLSRSPDGFFLERHPKLDPVGTNNDGIYIAGACQGPKDIPDTVAQAQAAAARMLGLISKGEAWIDPVRASIDEEKCSGCRICNTVCPYQAIKYDEAEKISKLNEILCKGCGSCVAACPSSAISGAGYTDEQVLSELEAILE
jgi:heterodisulfide reductase subunit A